MLALIVTLPVLLSALINRRTILVLAVILSVFMSRAFSLPMTENGAPITFTRMIYFPIFIIVLPTLLLRIFRFRLDLFGIGLLHVLVVTLATIAAGRLSTLPYTVDWFLSTYVFILCGGLYFQYGGQSRNIYRFIAVATLILFLFAILEIVNQRPIISMVSSIFPEGFSAISDKVLQGRIRSGEVRLQLFSDNPIRLGQHANLFYAFILAYSKERPHPSNLILAAMLGAIVFFAGSRSGIILFLMLTCLAVICKLPSVKQKSAVSLMRLLFLACIVYLGFITFQLISSYQGGFGVVKMYDQESEVRSSMERSMQIIWTINTWRQSPVFGIGFLPNAGENLESVNSLDSYVLRTLLEGGILGLLLFITFCLRYIRHAVNNLKESSEFGYLAVAMAVFWGAIFEYTFETFILSFFLLGYFEASLKHARRLHAISKLDRVSS